MATGCRYKLEVLCFVMAAQASYIVLAFTKLWTYLAKKKNSIIHWIFIFIF